METFFCPLSKDSLIMPLILKLQDRKWAPEHCSHRPQGGICTPVQKPFFSLTICTYKCITCWMKVCQPVLFCLFICKWTHAILGVCLVVCTVSKIETAVMVRWANGVSEVKIWHWLLFSGICFCLLMMTCSSLMCAHLLSLPQHVWKTPQKTITVNSIEKVYIVWSFHHTLVYFYYCPVSIFSSSPMLRGLWLKGLMFVL